VDVTRTGAAAALTALATLAAVVAGVAYAHHVGQDPHKTAETGATPGIHDTAAAGHASPPPATASKRLPLEGRVIVIDPGHQLGNSGHPSQVTRLVNAGGFSKPCNTSGTSTADGFPEARFNWLVSRALQAQLEARGATVHLTRHTDSLRHWGPCVDVRGRMGNGYAADAVVSVHADGADRSTRGFVVIRPGYRRGWTGDIVESSLTLARDVRRGLVGVGARVSNAYAGGYDVRRDLGTLNWSGRPIVMVELGNMRNPIDARHMRSQHYRVHVYARGLRNGLLSFLER
jgi:N-acetylmuramoyl-L-alanine amidase